MHIKTSELVGKQLRWAVAKSLGLNLDLGGWPARYQDGETYIDRQLQPVHIPHYEEWWEAGGPLAASSRISVYTHPDRMNWYASQQGTAFCREGASPLIAICRCFVASKLGDEVAIPEELL